MGNYAMNNQNLVYIIAGTYHSMQDIYNIKVHGRTQSQLFAALLKTAMQA